MSKYLIVGLGNVGVEYEATRHNAGFMVVDRLAKSENLSWSLERHAYRCEFRTRGHQVIMIKPTTLMNLSGKAVRYWLQAEKVDINRLLVVVDDIAIELGTLRMKKQGSSGGHNGLKDIEAMIGTNNYCRLRVGVGSNFSRGGQIDYVLGKFSAQEKAILDARLGVAAEMVKSFVTQGADRTMNLYNGTGK